GGMNAHTVPGGHPHWDDDTPILIGQAVEITRPQGGRWDGDVIGMDGVEVLVVRDDGGVVLVEPEHLRRIGATPRSAAAAPHRRPTCAARPGCRDRRTTAATSTPRP